MKHKRSLDEHGIAHLGVVLLAVLVIGLVGFAAYRVVGTNKDAKEAVSTSQSDTAAPADTDEESEADLDAAEKAVDKADATNQNDSEVANDEANL